MYLMLEASSFNAKRLKNLYNWAKTANHRQVRHGWGPVAKGKFGLAGGLHGLNPKPTYLLTMSEMPNKHQKPGLVQVELEISLVRLVDWIARLDSNQTQAICYFYWKCQPGTDLHMKTLNHKLIFDLTYTWKPWITSWYLIWVGHYFPNINRIEHKGMTWAFCLFPTLSSTYARKELS